MKAKIIEILHDRNFSNNDSYKLLEKFIHRYDRKDVNSLITENQLYNFCLSQGYVDKNNMPRGFTVTTPKGMIFEDIAKVVNEEFMDKDDRECQLPIVYKCNDQTDKLTERFENTKQVFKVTDKERCRLGYAADPNLFNWLQNRVLSNSAMGCRIRTLVPALRNFPSGSLNKLARVKQYMLADAHTFCFPKDTSNILDKIINKNLAILDFLGVDSRFIWIETTQEYHQQNPWLKDTISKYSQEANCVELLDEQSHYYSARIGIMTDSGYGALMLFNIQIDESNASAFNIRSEDTSHPTILHHNELTGSGLMTLFGGQLLAYDRVLPLWLAPCQVQIQYTSESEEQLELLSTTLNNHNFRFEAVRHVRRGAMTGRNPTIPFQIYLDGGEISVVDNMNKQIVSLPHLFRCSEQLGILSRHRCLKKNYVDDILENL